MAQSKKTERFTPKIEPLRAGILQQYKKCGRPNCRCVNGSLHGPYTYIVWMARGEQFKKYVRKSDLDLINARIAAYKRQQKQAREAKKSFGGLLRLLRYEARMQRAGINRMMREALGEQWNITKR